MSKNKTYVKAQPQKKKRAMSDHAKANLKLFFLSFVNNQACVDLGREKPWYGAILSAVLSVVLLCVPVLTGAMKTKGSDFLGSPTYGYENGLVHFQEDVKAYQEATGNDLDMKVTKEVFTMDQSAWNGTADKKGFFEYVDENDGSTAWSSSTQPWYHHVNSATGKVDFQVFYTTETGSGFTTYVQKVYKGLNPVISVPEKNAEKSAEFVPPILRADSTESASKEESAAASSSTSTSDSKDPNAIAISNAIIFGPKRFVVYKANAAGKYVANGGPSTVWYYKAQLPMKSILEWRSNNDITKPEVMKSYQEETLKEWKAWLNPCYTYYRNILAWRQVGIMAAVFAGFILIMGLMIFLMTRGKTNPFHAYTFWQTQKIAYWCAPSPAIIAMILMFISTQSIWQFSFVFVYAMRVLFLSMRTLNPNAGGR